MEEVIQTSYGETACHHALTLLCRVLRSAVNKDHPQQRAGIIENTYSKIIDWVDCVKNGTLLAHFHLVR